MDSQETLAEARLRHQLDVQSRQINRVLSEHHVPATVAGGSVRPKMVSFDIQSQIAAGLERVRGLKNDLVAALGATHVALESEQGAWRVRVDRPDEPPVPLLALLDAAGELPAVTAAVGMANSGSPVLLQFAVNRVRHVLIAGEDNAGKTTLLRTIAASLAFSNRQSGLQLVLLDSHDGPAERGVLRHHAFAPLSYLPHVLAEPAVSREDATAWLDFLAEEVGYRLDGNVRHPIIVALVDNVVGLLEAGGAAAQTNLLRVLQHGPDAGIHLVIAVEHPDSPYVDARLRSMISLRLVGRLSDESAESVRRIAGVSLDQAKLLYGRGDFIAVTGEERTYFQAALLGDYDLHLKLTEMYGRQRPRLLALPYNPRPQMATETAAKPVADRTFTMARSGVILEDRDAGEVASAVMKVDGTNTEAAY